MKFFKYIMVGFLFGFGAFKMEMVSFFRIYEMFLFQDFHMYGIIIGTITHAILYLVFFFILIYNLNIDKWLAFLLALVIWFPLTVLIILSQKNILENDNN